MKYTNPVIPGFNPDPSICRVGLDYYLVTSSFNYFPGVPIYHSRDLVHWRQVGNCLTRENQLPLRGAGTWGGIYAPSLRYHDGTFYMITTNVGGAAGHPGLGHFFVHTQDPAGEWSDPVLVEGEGFDPDLFFDDDGRAWFSRHAHNDRKGIPLWEIDIQTGKLIGPETRIWPGWEDDLCEAPHIYKINGIYYLLVAEGGTERSHMVTIGRSQSVTGPYEACPRNPILSHRSRVFEPIQQTGHADLIQAHDGSWWVVFLGIRLNYGYHNLGRETFLAPVTWQEDGWPLVNGGKAVQLEMDVPGLDGQPWTGSEGQPWTGSEGQPWPPIPTRDNFDRPTLELGWNFLRNLPAPSWSLNQRPGYLTLNGGAETLDETIEAPVFVGRKQQHFTCTATTSLEFEPSIDGEEAGLSAFQNAQQHYEIGLKCQDGRKFIFLRKRVGDLVVQPAEIPYAGSQVFLRIQAGPEVYRFSYSSDGQSYHPLGDGLSRYLSIEVAGGFTGAYFALYATGKGKPSRTRACFDWFDYQAS